MNNEVIKAMNKKTNEPNAFKKWWKKNGYIVMRVILFPIWGCVWSKDKITQWLNSRITWSEERANEILNYYIPRTSDWDEEDKVFYFFDNGYGWSMSFARKYLKLKDRRFWKVNTGFFGGKIRDYLIDSFELEGFTKEVNPWSDWTEVTFKMNEAEA